MNSTVILTGFISDEFRENRAEEDSRQFLTGEEAFGLFSSEVYSRRALVHLLFSVLISFVQDVRSRPLVVIVCRVSLTVAKEEEEVIS